MGMLAGAAQGKAPPPRKTAEKVQCIACEKEGKKSELDEYGLALFGHLPTDSDKAKKQARYAWTAAVMYRDELSDSTNAITISSSPRMPGVDGTPALRLPRVDACPGPMSKTPPADTTNRGAHPLPTGRRKETSTR